MPLVLNSEDAADLRAEGFLAPSSPPVSMLTRLVVFIVVSALLISAITPRKWQLCDDLPVEEVEDDTEARLILSKGVGASEGR